MQQVYTPRLESQRLVFRRDDIGHVNTVLKIINEELHTRRQKRAALARAIGASDQVVRNWWARGSVPPARYFEIASFFGLSVEQLLGVEPRPKEPTPPEPEAKYSKRANDLALMFDHLTDTALRQRLYAEIQLMLQMAISGQTPANRDAQAATPATRPNSPRPAHRPIGKPRQGR